MSGLFSILLLWSSGGSSTPYQESDLEGRVRQIVDQYFAPLPEARRRFYVERLVVALSGSSSPKHRSLVVEGLPKVARYFADEVDYYQRRAPSGHPLPPALIEEGYELYAEVLEAEVARAARSERSEADRRGAAEQLTRVVQEASSALKERLPGEAGSSYVDAHCERLLRGWLGQLDSPYHSIIHTPLAPGELQEVLVQIRKKAESFPATTLSEAEFADEARLNQVGVRRLFDDVRNAIAWVTKFSYKGQPDFGAREQEWQSKARAKLDELVSLDASGDAAPAASPPRTAIGQLARGEPGGAGKIRTPANADTPPPPLPAGERRHAPVREEGNSGIRWAAVILIALLLGIGFRLVRVRRKA
jgi:hypothetical protein